MITCHPEETKEDLSLQMNDQKKLKIFPDLDNRKFHSNMEFSILLTSRTNYEKLFFLLLNFVSKNSTTFLIN